MLKKESKGVLQFLQAGKVIELPAGTALIAYVSADTLIAGEAR